MEAKREAEAGLAQTGIAGLDEVLRGGLPRRRVHLIQGNPGGGKTTLALEFLREGVRSNEPGLYITLSETADELVQVAKSHNWSLDGITLFELTALERTLASDAENTIFHPAEVELTEITKALLETVERTKPSRVVFDSLSELRLLARDPLRYRRQILTLKQFFSGRSSTVLFLDDNTGGNGTSSDLQLQSLAHGVIGVEHLSPEYGSERRRLRVVKMRGREFSGGYHDFVIRRGGISLFPRLVSSAHHRVFKRDFISSGVPEIDQMLGGGLERGLAALVMGPAGSGKSSLVSQYVNAAAARGERSSLFLFDENLEVFLTRSKGLGADLTDHVQKGLVQLRQVDPAELSPGEFICKVRESVEKTDTRIVVIDSLNGYLNSMPEERFLLIQLHELFTYLSQRGVLTFLVMAQHGLVGTMESPVDATYLADSVILLRFFESRGEVRQALSVLKKRTGGHEHTIRELRLTSEGIRVGPPLSEFQGVLAGIPTYLGGTEKLRG